MSFSACSSDIGRVSAPSGNASTVIVSDPSPSAALASRGRPQVATLSPGGSSAADVAYVSLPPGAVAGGVLAAIRNLRTAVVVTAPMTAGGFDPVSVDARIDDALELTAMNTVGTALFSVADRVPAKRPPRVVRTLPPRGKTDVPLNARIIVVFSEPVDPRTVSASSIRLFHGVVPVAGRIAFLEDDRLSATFVPDAPLALATAYQLIVTQTIRDLDGEPLEEPVSVEFTTESVATHVASVVISPPSAALAPREAIRLVATAYDSHGNSLSDRATVWSVADASIAMISAAGQARGVSLGSTSVTASIEGRTATATIDVRQLSFVAVIAGVDHTCALTDEGEAYCWGYNNSGRLGTGDTVSSPRPRAVVGAVAFTSLSVGQTHSCGLTTAGVAYCWGSNGSGELGDGTTAASTTPVAVTGGLSFVQLAAGWDLWGGSHTCGLTLSGRAYCWGDGRFGQLGNGRGDTDTARYDGSLTPIPVAGDVTFKSLTGALQVTCGLATDGAAYCWGAGAQVIASPVTGASGSCVLRGSVFVETCITRPVPIVGGLSFAALSAGMYAACGLTPVGAAYCWGAAPERGAPGPRGHDGPLAVPGGISFAVVSVGWNPGFSCGVSAAGAAYCWGVVPTDAGPTWTRTEWLSEPRAVDGGRTFAAISVGANHACGVTRGDGIYCWGANYFGQLGSSKQIFFSASPVKVAAQR